MGFLGDLLSSIWKVLKVILVIALVALAIWFTGGGALTIFGSVFTGGWAALASLGLALLIDPEFVTEVATKLGSTVGDLAGAVVGAVASASGIGGLLLYGALAYGAYLLFTNKSDKDESAKPTTESEDAADRKAERLGRERKAIASRAINLTPSYSTGGI